MSRAESQTSQHAKETFQPIDADDHREQSADVSARLSTFVADLVNEKHQFNESLNLFDKVVHHDFDDPATAGAVPVLFFTDRAAERNADGKIGGFLPSNIPNSENEVTMGRMAGGNPGVLPGAFASPSELAAHSGKATEIQVQETYDRNKFLDEVASLSQNSKDHKIAVVVPGYGMNFDTGASSAAELQRLSNIPVVYYSWPSRDLPTIKAYKADERNDSQSMKNVGGPMIDAIAQRIGPENVISVGFSQGGKILTEYINNRQHESGGKAEPFYAQVLVRSDGARSEVSNNLSAVINNAEHTALINSLDDRLLKGSGLVLHPGELRTGTGLAKDFPVPLSLQNKFQVIDNSRQNNGTTNHIFDAEGVADWLKGLK